MPKFVSMAMLLLLAVAVLAVTRGLAISGFRGLVNDTAGRLSGARLQGLIVTLAFAVSYGGSVVLDPNATEFPAISSEILLLLAGSGGIYLSSKALGGLDRLLPNLRG